MDKTKLAIAIVSIAVASWTIDGRAQQPVRRPNRITAMSVCGAGTTTSLSCPTGTFDTE